jgi:hypothetical protein
MTKSKLAIVMSGTAILGSLACAPLARAYDDAPVTERSAPDSNPVVLEGVPPGSRVLVLEPGATLAATPQFPPNETPISYRLGVARQPGSVPTPYGDLPGSGHVGDEYYNKQQGGVPG